MRVCGACDAGRRERMGRVRSVCALQLFYALAGERFSGVRRACAGDNIWGGLFDWGRGGPRKARGGVLELTLGQQGPEPARRQRRREEQSFFAWASALREQQQACRVKAACEVRGVAANFVPMLRVSGVSRPFTHDV